ncbi:MAG TPA: hypothetical protein GXX75_02200 [Clostridiales bacterium]|nr:hypothetical protein [Clostridiales bacterium]
MSRTKKIIRNIFIITILSFFITSWLGLSLTPLAAHKKSERGIHYGPSEVVHIEDYKNSKFILGKYDKWVSCNTVNRVLLFFWAAGSQPIGFENEKGKALCYTWLYSNSIFKAYGIINDKNIKKIEVTLTNGKILTQTEFYDDMFLLIYDKEDGKDTYFDSIRGYDAENKMIFEGR